MLRIPFADLYAALHRATLALGLTDEPTAPAEPAASSAPATPAASAQPEGRAALCARLFAETTRDGVYTHGLNRFPRFTAAVRNGSVNIHARPERVSLPVVSPQIAGPQIAGPLAIERWDGHFGPGNLAAHASMTRAIELAHTHGLGVVALAHTNHWMRGGTYGWLAADAGLFAICWTNTMPNLPAWGGTNAALGNNPLILAVPRREGPIVLDMAMSQFSYGTLEAYRKRGAPLPVDGGFDTAGQLTTDAAAIEASQRALPIGYWKGSGLAIMLDLFAAMLAGGLATHQIAADPARESGVSQFFLAIDPATFASADELARIADGVLASIRDSVPADPGQPVRYPGEQTLRLREENLRLGVPVDPEIWQRLNASAL